MSSVPVIKFLFRTEWKVLSDALQLRQPYESESFDSANDLTTYLSGSHPCLIIASLRDKNDLIQIATFMKQVKKVAPNSYFKVIVINYSADKQFEKAIANLGILDMVDQKIQPKALRFKIDFLMKSINAHLKNQPSSQAGSNNVKTLEANASANEKKSIENVPSWLEGLDCDDDVWLLRNDSDCKKVLTRWMVKFMGPSPYVASWVDSGTSGIWKFEFRSGQQDFIFGKGTWFYRGDQKPDFIWSDNSWLFTGRSFDLFYKDGDSIKSRLKLNEKVLFIAKNSEYAKTKESKIIESFDKELVFKKDQASKLDMETIDKEQEKYKNLEGKGKTDQVDVDPLSGKGKTDNIIQDPLSGKGKTSQLSSDPLSMDLKPGENSLSSDHLEQTSQSTKEKIHWNGRNAYGKEGEADDGLKADQKINEGSLLSKDGKSNHEKFYRNYNEAEKFDAKELGGKSSTDQIEGHLRSPDAKKTREQVEKSQEKSGSIFDREKKEREQKAFQKQSSRDISERSSTDDLGGLLTSPDAKKAIEENDKFSGNSSTDNLGGPLSSPDGKKSGSNQEKPGSDLAGKSSTNKLGGPLSSPVDRDSQSKKDEKKAGAALYLQARDEREKKRALEETEADRNSIESSKRSKSAHGSSEGEFIDDPSKKSQGPEDDIYSDSTGGAGKTKSKNTGNAESSLDGKNQKDENGNGKVIPFVAMEKEKAPAELAESMQEAKVTSVIIHNGKKVYCDLDDFFDETIIFSTPDPAILGAKVVSLNMNFNYMNKDTNLKFEGNVRSVEPDGEGANFVTVEITKEHASAFNTFMKLYTTRQQHVNIFLKTVKGF